MSKIRVSLVAALLAGLAGPALAQDELPEAQLFGDGELTFDRGEDNEIVLRYRGEELYRNQHVWFNRIANIEGQDVAILSGGDGGNACGPNALILSLPADSVEAKLDVIGECGSPEPAVTENEIYFVPYVRPGASLPVQSWTPSAGLVSVGMLHFEPKAGTSWANFDPAKVQGPWDMFDNADVYAAGKALLGERFSEVTQGLAVAGPPGLIDGNFLAGAGCAPHACGSTNAFFGVDIAAKAVFAAYRNEGKPDEFWPADFKAWPAQMQKAYEDSKIAP